MRTIALSGAFIAFGLMAPCAPLIVSAGDTAQAQAETAEPPKDPSARISDLEKQLEELQKDKAALIKKLADLEARLSKLEKAGGAPLDIKATKNFEEAMVQLDISDAEKDAIRESVKKCKKAMIETMQVPTKDGRIVAEELIDAFIKSQSDNEDAAAEIQRVFLFMSSEKVPGDEKKRTYVQIVEEHKKLNRQAISKILNPADQRRLDACHADWADFELGEDDPFTELYLARLSKMGKKDK